MEERNAYVVVVGTDFSEASDAAIGAALRIGHTRGPCEIHVVHVDDDLVRKSFLLVQPDPDPEELALDKLEQLTQTHMAELSRSGPTAHLERIITHLRHGAPAQEVVQLASDLDADLVVVGSHGHRGLMRYLLGSVSEKVVRLAPCPVLVTRPKHHTDAGRAPEIEPPCPACVAKRKETGMKDLWCDAHSAQKKRHRQTYQSR